MQIHTVHKEVQDSKKKKKSIQELREGVNLINQLYQVI